jgi:hypothetical protein
MQPYYGEKQKWLWALILGPYALGFSFTVHCQASMENYIISFWSGLQFHKIFVYKIQHLLLRLKYNTWSSRTEGRFNLEDKNTRLLLKSLKWTDNNVLTFHKENDMQCTVLTEKLWTSLLLVTCLLLVTDCTCSCIKGLIRKKVGGSKESPRWQFTEVRIEHVSVLCCVAFLLRT